MNKLDSCYDSYVGIKRALGGDWSKSGVPTCVTAVRVGPTLTLPYFNHMKPHTQGELLLPRIQCRRTLKHGSNEGKAWTNSKWVKSSFIEGSGESCKPHRDFILLLVLEWPPLCSNGHSAWLQTKRSRVRFPALPHFSEAVVVERGPLSLVRINEELLERQEAGSAALTTRHPSIRKSWH
jgi:hypothetical protein